MVGGAGDEGGVGGETSRRVRLQSGSTDQLRRSSFDTELGKASLSWMTCRMRRPWRNIVGRKLSLFALFLGHFLTIFHQQRQSLSGPSPARTSRKLSKLPEFFLPFGPFALGSTIGK
ncbi:hypothetical protein AOLI_G00226860 [Acnodon oligacanthus]